MGVPCLEEREEHEGVLELQRVSVGVFFFFFFPSRDAATCLLPWEF